jgi:hypothetical protein
MPLAHYKGGVAMSFRASSHIILMLYWSAQEGPWRCEDLCHYGA